MIRLALPYALLLLIPAAIAAWAMLARRRAPGFIFAASPRLGLPRPTVRQLLLRLAPYLFLGGLLLLIVALARPQLVSSKSVRHADALAIQMVVDISGSMEALDFSTRTAERSRLDVVKETFLQFIDKRAGDLIGLVTFGGYAVSRVPLTLDHDALRHVLAAVEIPRLEFDARGRVTNQEEQLTAIGDALATASARLEKAEVKSKLIVLLSDGESNAGLIKPDQAAQAAKALGIKVYTIGVGSSGRVPIRTRDAFGREAIQYAVIPIDEALLQRIADVTGGQYFNVRNPQGLERALADIDKLERTTIQQETYDRYTELFPRFLWSGLLALTLGLALNLNIRKEPL